MPSMKTTVNIQIKTHKPYPKPANADIHPTSNPEVNLSNNASVKYGKPTSSLGNTISLPFKKQNNSNKSYVPSNITTNKPQTSHSIQQIPVKSSNLVTIKQEPPSQVKPTSSSLVKLPFPNSSSIPPKPLSTKPSLIAIKPTTNLQKKSPNLIPTEPPIISPMKSPNIHKSPNTIRPQNGIQFKPDELKMNPNKSSPHTFTKKKVELPNQIRPAPKTSPPHLGIQKTTKSVLKQSEKRSPSSLTNSVISIPGKFIQDSIIQHTQNPHQKSVSELHHGFIENSVKVQNDNKWDTKKRPISEIELSYSESGNVLRNCRT